MTDKLKKIKLNKSQTILIIGIIVVMIPVIALGVILIDAYYDTGTPISGTRLDSERTQVIQQEQLNQLNTSLQSNGKIEKVSVELKVSTLRIYLDVKDDVTAVEYEPLLDNIYDRVMEIFPVETYFTAKEMKKEYDLEIHAYNDVALAEEDSYLYYILVKNSTMSMKRIDVVSTPRNEALVNELLPEDNTDQQTDSTQKG